MFVILENKIVTLHIGSYLIRPDDMSCEKVSTRVAVLCPIRGSDKAPIVPIVIISYIKCRRQSTP